MSEYINVDTIDGGFSAYLARPKLFPAPAIVVIQEIFGVNADLRQTCDELATLGYLALSPDLFWRQEADLDMSADSEADWKKGMALYHAFDVAAGVNDIAATMDVARSLRGATGKVGVMGFCFGGLMTYLTAVRKGPDAAVDYYGMGVEKYLDEAAKLSTPLIIHLGEEDEFISKEAQRAITKALRDNVHAQVFSYPGQAHAFARHRGAHYDRHTAAVANARSIAFFDLHLRPASGAQGSGNNIAEDPLGMWVA